MSSDRLDFVIFGASGFTGQFVVEFAARAQQKEEGAGRELTVGVAGRSKDKLSKVLDNATKATGIDNLKDKLEVIVADVSDQSSLEAMARRAQVVLNCVGPYRFYGEQVVKACLASGAHHLDISGEPQFLETMQLKYDEEARNKGLYIVGSCGFDSIPSDVGQMYLTKKMGGDVNSIETFLKNEVPDLPGPMINFATYQSAVHGFANADKLKDIRKKLYPERLPKMQPKLVPRSQLSFVDRVDSWCMHFPGADRSVMMRTQRARYHNDGERPAQIGCYVQMSSLFYAILTMFFGAIFGIMASFGFGRKMLEAYPGFFSCGTVSKQGPSKEMAENTNFIMTLIGYGWKTKEDEHADKPNRQVTITASGKNVGYGATCEYLVQSSLCVLRESDRMPGEGGVLTPGYAFKDTTLVERCNMNDVPFTAVVKDL